jgi:tetratricopeptide (TPR) repeat protein
MARRARNAVRKPFLYFAILITSLTTILTMSLQANDVDGTWKDLLLKAQRASTEHDLAGAEQLYQKALHEAERFGVNDARVATTVAGLGSVFHMEKKLAEAEEALRRALSILDGGVTAESQDVADLDFKLGLVMADQGKPAAAFLLFNKSLSILAKQVGGQSLQAAAVHCAIGETHMSLRAWSDAEAPLARCAELREADGGVLNAGLGDALFSLAIVYEKQGKFVQADPRYKLAEKIREYTLGITSPQFADVLESHARLLKTMGRAKDAERDLTLASAIRRREKKPVAENVK